MFVPVFPIKIRANSRFSGSFLAKSRWVPRDPGLSLVTDFFTRLTRQPTIPAMSPLAKIKRPTPPKIARFYLCTHQKSARNAENLVDKGLSG